MIHSFKSSGITYQRVPTHLCMLNAAERAIRTFKNHLTAGLCTLNPKFPFSYWDYLLTQATITLNLLRSARRNPLLSPHAAVFGQLNFDATPLTPPRTKVVIHEKTMKSFGTRGRDRLYICLYLKNYRCYRFINSLLGRATGADTIEFMPRDVPFPSVTADEYIYQATTDILHILQNKNDKILSLTFGKPITNAFI